jgi:hypothetical protein
MHIGDSHFWSGLMALKKFFFRCGTLSINDGSQIWFWEDIWLDNAPLWEQYPDLYNIVRHKGDTIAKIMATSPPDVTFIRDLLGPRCLERLTSMFGCCSAITGLRWIPLKSQCQWWYLRRGVILTKDNFVKCNWHRSTRCVFCHQDETITHLFFYCRFVWSVWSLLQTASTLYPPTSVANIFRNWLHGIYFRFRVLIRVWVLAVIWSLWLCINDKVFNDKNYSLLQVIYRCTSMLRLWSPLQRIENVDLFMEVYTRLEAMARDNFPPHGWPHNLRIVPPPSP